MPKTIAISLRDLVYCECVKVSYKTATAEKAPAFTHAYRNTGTPVFAKAGLRLFERAQAISSSVDMEWVMRIARLTASDAVVPVAKNSSIAGLVTRLPVLTGAAEGPEVTGLGLTRGVITGDFNGDGAGSTLSPQTLHAQWAFSSMRVDGSSRIKASNPAWEKSPTLL